MKWMWTNPTVNKMIESIHSKWLSATALKFHVELKIPINAQRGHVKMAAIFRAIRFCRAENWCRFDKSYFFVLNKFALTNLLMILFQIIKETDEHAAGIYKCIPCELNRDCTIAAAHLIVYRNITWLLLRQFSSKILFLFVFFLYDNSIGDTRRCANTCVCWANQFILGPRWIDHHLLYINITKLHNDMETNRWRKTSEQFSCKTRTINRFKLH